MESPLKRYHVLQNYLHGLMRTSDQYKMSNEHVKMGGKGSASPSALDQYRGILAHLLGMQNHIVTNTGPDDKSAALCPEIQIWFACYCIELVIYQQ